MKKKRIIIILSIAAAVVLASIAAYAFYQNKAATPAIDQSKESSADSPMNNQSAAYKKYAALKGEEYDKAFIGDMIIHHDSALNMAEIAGGSANRQEIRDLSADIIVSQSKERIEMTAWQKEWGYPVTNGHMMIGKAGNESSMEGMAMMNDELLGLSGDAFDKKFLELMIVHHQDAIDMSRPAEANASHQEVKDLAKAIIAAQSKEITQMQQWQTEWGYTNG